MNKPKIKILHIITCLDTGGAEKMLYKLIGGFDRDCFDISVISLKNLGAIGPDIQALGVSVEGLQMKGPFSVFAGFLALLKAIHRIKPDIVQTWLYHADFLGGMAAKMACCRHIIWNFRTNDCDKSYIKFSTRVIVKLLSFLSFWVPEKIITCSEKSLQRYRKNSYVAKKFVVIPNGFNVNEFKPNNELKTLFREEQSIPSDSVLVGTIGRFDPQKDYLTFIKATQLISKQFPNVRYVMCGKDLTVENSVLMGWILKYNQIEKFYLLGPSKKVNHILSALDLFVLSSLVEGFPNVIGEAMLSGVPCVATDVGDASHIIGEIGFIVPPKDYKLLASKVCEILSLPSDQRSVLEQASRDTIKENYALDDVVKQYEHLYFSIMDIKEQ